MLKYLGRWVKTFDEWSDKMLATWKWHDTIMLLNESYGMTAICTFINLNNQDWSTVGSSINAALSCIAPIYLIVFPFFSAGWLFFNYEELPKNRFREVYGSLYLDLETNKKDK